MDQRQGNHRCSDQEEEAQYSIGEDVDERDLWTVWHLLQQALEIHQEIFQRTVATDHKLWQIDRQGWLEELKSEQLCLQDLAQDSQ